MKYPNRKKEQTTLEYIIIIALVAIAAIAGSIMYYHATSGTSVGSGDSILAAGYNTTTNTITVALSQALPTGVSDVTLKINSKTTTNPLSQLTPTYVDNYPEYTFTANIVSTPVTVTSMTYNSPTGQNVIIPTESGSPIAATPVSGNVVQP